MVLLCLRTLIEVEILKSAHRLGLGDQKREKMGPKPQYFQYFWCFSWCSWTKMAITGQPMGRLLHFMVVILLVFDGLFQKSQKHGVGSICAEKMRVKHKRRRRKFTEISSFLSLFFRQKRHYATAKRRKSTGDGSKAYSCLWSMQNKRDIGKLVNVRDKNWPCSNDVVSGKSQ